VTCTCGESIALAGASGSPSRASSAVATAGPYRAASGRGAPTEPTLTCPYCSNEIVALVRICPHCDVRLDNVRCARCFSLQTPGAFACGRCGQPMELEPFLDATDAPCPRCVSPLELTAEASHARTHECPRCGGIFVSRDALADILCRAEIGGSVAESPPRRSAAVLDEVRYLPCPQCHTTMNRANFGKISGIIVDVCSKHGTWFDAGELTRAIVFAANGGLERSRARAQEEKKADAARAAVSTATEPFRAFDADERLGAWRDFLSAVFHW
jgi:Zn-finger nucleic acid-binding protein